jgi:molybdenum cofactor biosynthesis enzyme MoaA
LTSNGFNPTLWPALRDAGLKKTNFSIHTLSDVEFARFHRTPHTIVWARQSLQNTIDSVLIAKELGMTVKVNTTIVRPTSQWRPIFEFCKNTGIPWRAQNELDSPTAVAAIGEIIASVGGQLVQIIRKTPTSRISYEYKDTDGYHFSVKLITPASLHHLCSECKVQANCTEGFYTLRLEPNASGDSFNIRLCLHRTDAGSVFSPDAFVRSEVFKELSKKYQRNFAYSTSN